MNYVTSGVKYEFSKG